MSKKTIILVILFLATVAVGALRVLLPSHGLHLHDTFKDMAHVYVGVLIGAGAASRCLFIWSMALALIITEVAAVLETIQ